MNKTFETAISITGIAVIIIAWFLFLFSEVEFYKFVLLFAIGLIMTSLRVYDFPNIDQFLYIGAAWFLGIYALSSMVAEYETLPFLSLNIGIWYLIYPSIVILYQLTELSNDKKWHVTSIAATDTFAIFGAILLLVSAMNSLGMASFSAGISGDWRELFIYGIGLLLYATYKRDEFKDETKVHWNYYWKITSAIIAFCGGLLLLGVSIFSFIVINDITVPLFLVEALGGIFVCFMVYLLFQKNL
jgi:hypothetical protein